METALAIGGYHDSEQKLVVQLFDKIPDDALLLEDRNFFSYDHWKELDSRGVKLLVRIKCTMSETDRTASGRVVLGKDLPVVVRP